MKSGLRQWRLKKAGIIAALVITSAVGAWGVHFGAMWLLIPVVLILLMIWVLGRKGYACPHCKTPMDLRLSLHEDIKCTKCGKSIME